MGEHHTFGLITRGATGEHDVAAHSWSLVLDLPVNDAIFYFISKLHDLRPIVDLEELALVNCVCSFRRETLIVDEASDDSELRQLLLMRVQELHSKCLVCVAYNDLGFCLRRLVETYIWVVRHIYVREYAIRQDSPHD